MGRRTASLAALDDELAHHLDRAARIKGFGAAAVTLATGGAVWCALIVGIPAVRSGALPSVLLAMVVLVPLALADVLAPLPATVAELAVGRPPHACWKSSNARTRDRTNPPPQATRRRHTASSCQICPPDGQTSAITLCVTWTSTCPRGDGSPSWAKAAAERRRWRWCCCAFSIDPMAA